MNLIQVFEEAKENLALTEEEYRSGMTIQAKKPRYICLAIEFRRGAKSQYAPETRAAIEIVASAIAPYNSFTSYLLAQRGYNVNTSPETFLGTFEEIQQLRLEFIDSIIAKLKAKEALQEKIDILKRVQTSREDGTARSLKLEGALSSMVRGFNWYTRIPTDKLQVIHDILKEHQ